MSLPRPELEDYLRPITEAVSWQEALTQFARLGPITGDARVNRETVTLQQQQFPLSALFPPVQLGGDNLPRFRPGTDEERLEYQLAMHEAMLVQLRATLVHEALVRIIVSHPMPSVEDLTAYFCTNRIIPPATGVAIARAFLRYWAGDAEGAAFTIIPRIEALARNLLLNADFGIYRTQRAKSPAQYPGLRFLLDQLAARGLDESWHRYIVVMCTHVVGFNLRNEMAHGFVDWIDDGVAALLLQIAAHLSGLTPVSQSDPPES